MTDQERACCSIKATLCSRPRFQHIRRPVPHEVRADGHVVHLAMMETAFLSREHLEQLLLRADRLEALLRDAERNLLVARAVHQQERTPHLLHDAVESEA